MEDFIRIKGAREHNLQGVDVDIPKNNLVVITGLSGSGKSSLAFDTIYAEGQRRYVESLSTYARQFLNIEDKPDVESITGLSPTISINQKSISKSPRSTVGTVTEIYDYLRLMYARIGVPYSPVTGLPIRKQTISQIVDAIMALPLETKVYILAPIVRDRKGEHLKEILEIRRQGYVRLKIDGRMHDISDLPKLDKSKRHDIFVIIDKVSISDDIGNRLPSSIESALRLGHGLIYVEIIDLPNDRDSEYKNGHILTFSENFTCPESGFTLREIEPGFFSFNSPYGACGLCNGLGKKLSVDIKLIVPDETLSISKGALRPLGPIFYQTHKNYGFLKDAILLLAENYKFSLDVSWKNIDQKVKDVILFGSREMGFQGLVNILECQIDYDKTLIERYCSIAYCKECTGYRLRKEALTVKIDEKHIGEISRFSIDESLKWFENLPSKLTEQQKQISIKILNEVVKRLIFLRNVGLNYLTLDRESSTLSSGESQRIRLASQIGSGLTGVLYVLDEPSVGLHQYDNYRLITTLKNLRDIGNTVIVVEHDEDTIMAADYVIDIGYGAGINGGRIIAEGTPDHLQKSSKSITGQYLSGRRKILIPKRRKQTTQFIKVINACENNLKNISVEFPIGNFICVTGISGGGKSSLVIETLYKYSAYKIYHSSVKHGRCDKIEGLEYIDKVIEVDQSPIGKTPTSNPATYVGVFTHIRNWFAGLPESKARGYSINRFSFNAKGGRCEACKGDGHLKIEMHFLPDVYVKCEQCKGQRYNRETLEVTYKGKSIFDVLDMTIDQACDFFENLPMIKEKLVSLQEVGLGYVKLGQSSTTLSGGEAQRIKLSKELSKRFTGRTLYILDEPTIGLHFEDVNNLLKVLHKLVDLKNTVIVIEHNLHVIKNADYIVDIGPEGGVKGGEVVAKGTPESIIDIPESITGKYLKSYLSTV
ncbi:excinuclease ABC subunit UvrA [Wolbachia endosymbiont of Dirofilaria (Dirofilaria) immitis]|uniref:excinuclease ABC subunit UvrA n=1 Tax=Wolbachia endosymbiont of Dirofilaria (Dirofilaria) immitis TaxID=1812115 RepID=UPI00158D922B|nr:excinuclease ABC subunit UvrA [Wolbachia endosymbiont of Dirofilaria (Dirofilaria) immitis]QKX02012.1 excinuclease ABC subunit UvrA [Wolbachia endosymbiont of Dirofilaria (Dirofilaria) immitis]